MIKEVFVEHEKTAYGRDLDIYVKSLKKDVQIVSFLKDVPESANIVGYVSLDRKCDDSENCSLLKLRASEDYLEVTKECKKSDEIRGYIQLDDNGHNLECVAITEKPAIPLIPILLGIFLIIAIVVKFVIPDTPEDLTQVEEPTTEVAEEVGTRTLADGEDFDGNPNSVKQEEVGKVTFAGYTTLYVNDKNEFVYLMNLEKNDTNFTYTIFKAGTDEVLLEETGLIEPGKAIKWDPRGVLGKGTYKIDMIIKPYERDEAQTPCDSVGMTNVTLVIE